MRSWRSTSACLLTHTQTANEPAASSSQRAHAQHTKVSHSLVVRCCCFTFRSQFDGRSSLARCCCSANSWLNLNSFELFAALLVGEWGKKTAIGPLWGASSDLALKQCKRKCLFDHFCFNRTNRASRERELEKGVALLPAEIKPPF